MFKISSVSLSRGLSSLSRIISPSGCQQEAQLSRTLTLSAHPLNSSITFLCFTQAHNQIILQLLWIILTLAQSKYADQKEYIGPQWTHHHPPVSPVDCLAQCTVHRASINYLTKENLRYNIYQALKARMSPIQNILQFQVVFYRDLITNSTILKLIVINLATLLKKGQNRKELMYRYYCL